MVQHEGMLVFWPHSVLTKSLTCKRCCKQGFHLSKHFQKTLQCKKDRRNSDSLSVARMTCHPVRTPDRLASFIRTKFSFRSDLSTISRRFYPACIRPDVSAARPNASQYSISFIFLSKFQEREDQSTVRTMWYPVWTRVSLRQESQFKYHCPDVSQPWSERTCY
jgi:hypothetical protein